MKMNTFRYSQCFNLSYIGHRLTHLQISLIEVANYYICEMRHTNQQHVVCTSYYLILLDGIFALIHAEQK